MFENPELSLNSTSTIDSQTLGVLGDNLIPNTELNRTFTGISTEVSTSRLEASAQAIANTNTIVDRAGNTLETARSISIGKTPRTFTDWVGSTDINDYYRFTFNETKGLNLVLDGLTSNANIQLLNSNGQVIASSTRTGTTAENIIRQLNAGTYYLRVFPRIGDTSYNLTLSAIPDKAGNTLSTAKAISVTSTPRTFQDGVGAADPNDYYGFTLNQNSSFNLSLDGLTSNADVQILNSNGRVIASSTFSGSNPENIIRPLDAGTYYVRVFRRSGETFYNLSLSAIPDLAGNHYTTARAITVNSQTRTYRDWVGEADSNDYYRFSLNRTSTFNLTLDGLTADADVMLLNSNRQVIAYPWQDGTTPETLTTELEAGTYYLRVFPFSGETYYNLRVNATPFQVPPDYAGNTLADARNITVTSDFTTYQDWVGSQDPSDYYSFTLDNADYFYLELDNGGTSAYTLVDLLDSNGDWIDWSYSGYGVTGYIYSYLDAGDYYVYVYPYDGSSSYTLGVGLDSWMPVSSPKPTRKDLSSLETPVLTRKS